MAIMTMSRYEVKFILTKAQVENFTKMISEHMEVDEYGLTSIASLYYDTPDSRLIRASIEKPEFKEKIRLRSYGLAKDGSPLFLELKRKVDGVVYKRRIATTQSKVDDFFGGGELKGGQIEKEISYFRSYYKKLVPACLIIYDRAAYRERLGDLRLTIDYNPRYRLNNLNLSTNMEGVSLLPDGCAILEVKAQGAIPLWLSAIMSQLKIYKSNFSKYGEAYKKVISKQRRAA